MAQQIKLIPNELKKIRTVDERLMSYNIEMTEITGGTFWKACDLGHFNIVGHKPFVNGAYLFQFIGYKLDLLCHNVLLFILLF